jgi:hypothetical protein
MERILEAAASEIDDEIDLADDAVIDSRHLDLVEQVNLQRAAELWSLQPVPLNIVGGEMGSVHLSKDTWDKYANMLSRAKDQWGLA